MKKTIFALLLTVFIPVFFVNIAAQGPGEPVLTEPGKAAIAEAVVMQLGHSDGNTDQLTITVERETLAVNPTTHSSEICLNDTTQLYANASGGIGTYTYSWTSEPEGFTSAEANPLVVPQETTIYSVTVDDGYNQAFGQVTVTVHPLPDVTCPQNISTNIADEPFALTGADPPGGTYNGPGVVNGEFDPVEASVGIHTITYEYTDENGCSNSCTFTITVFDDIICPGDFAVCCDEEPFALEGASPPGGIYTGEGIAEGIFTPSCDNTGDILITYTYTDSDSGLVVSCTFIITVNPLPEIAECPEYGPFCQGDDPVAFTENGEFTYLGEEITGWNPDEAGEFDITYTVTDPDTGCTNSCTFTITVNELPEFDCPVYGPFCLGDDEFTFTETEGVFAYEGQEITGWSPDQAGSFEITYTVTDEDTHCSDFCTFTIVVHELPQFTIEGPNMVCPNLKNAEYEADITNFPLTDIELPPEWVVVNGDIEHQDSNKAWISWHNKPGEQGKITLTVKNKHTGCERTLFDQPITFSSHHQAPEPEEIVNKTLNDKTVILIYPEPNLEYQWFKNDTEMTGEIGQYYYPGSMGFSPGDEYKVLVEPLNVNDFLCGNFSEPVTILEPKLYDFIPHNLFLMYPNPAGDHIVIVLNEEHSKMSYDNCKAIIYNESGELLKSKSLNQWENQLSVSELSAGIYLVAIWVNGKREIKRMIKN